MGYKSVDKISCSEIAAEGIPSDAADLIYEKLKETVRNATTEEETWKRISKEILTPELPFSLHQMFYYGCYTAFGPDPPAWLPDPERAGLTNVGQLLEKRGKELLGVTYKDPITSFCDFQKFTVSNPEVAWKAVLDELCISFSALPECILREIPSHPGGQWLPGAHLNPAKCCLSVNSKRNLDDTVIIWRDEGDDEMPIMKMALKELRTEVWYVRYNGKYRFFCKCFDNHYTNLIFHDLDTYVHKIEQVVHRLIKFTI